MPWSMILEAAAQLTRDGLFPIGALWTIFWPARHALLTVTLILMYVHSTYEPSSDEDPFTF